ncbi:MAG: cytochrome-c peroxidase, partial [Thermodesulfovibrionales bacterium]
MSGMRIVFVLFVAAFVMAHAGNGMAMTPEEQLGKLIYFDANLSNPPGQACADCHHPTAGFTDPDHAFPVSEGVIPGKFGGRSAPTSAYAVYSPYFSRNEATGEYVGGQF